MSMSMSSRRQACIHFIRNGFDAEKTVKWFLTEYASNATVQRAKHPERLARNIIAMGGDGDQREMNIAAFNDALRVFMDEEKERQSALARQKIAGLESDLKKAYDQRDASQLENSRLHQRVEHLNDLLRSAERSQLAIAEPAAA